MLKYDLNIKEKPEHFLVSEKAEFKTGEGIFYLYLLVKKGFNTLDIAKKYNLSYAGLKDKNAITFQFTTSDKFLGEFIRYKGKNSFYFLKFLGKTNKKIKIGMLKGNFFSVKKHFEVKKTLSYFINYYDTQRVKPFNIKKGREILLSNKKRLSKKENFFVDAYLSYLWNESLKLYLEEKFQGEILFENNIEFFIPSNLNIDKLPKFWTIPGYKVKLEESEEFYEEILKREGFTLDFFLDALKNRRIKGDYRRLYEKVEYFSEKGNYISFYLNKGAYATMLLKFLYAENIVF